MKIGAIGRLVGLWLCAFLLSGCFVSEQPFITDATADYPLPAEGILVGHKFVNGEWERTETFKLMRNGAYYLVSEENGRDGGSFLLKSLGGNRYVFQTELSDGSGHGYALLVIDGKRISLHLFDASSQGSSVYRPNCGELSQADQERLGLVVDAIGCRTPSFEALAEVFNILSRSDEIRPDTIYELK